MSQLIHIIEVQIDFMNFVTLSINETKWPIPIYEGFISYFDAVLFRSLILVYLTNKEG